MMLMDIEAAQDLAEINHLREEVAKLRKENEDLKKVLWAVADKVKDFKKGGQAMTELFESTMDNVSELEVRGYSDPDGDQNLEIWAKSGGEEYVYKFKGPGVELNVLSKIDTENEKLREENKQLKQENETKCENCLAGASYEEMYRNLRDKLEVIF